ncbi:MAG: TIGR02221 family CRISPR-associated protein [Bacteroidota bacterium]
MRKILLSFLGTNNYIPCNYYIEGHPDQKVDDVRYIQEAIVKLYFQDITSNDQVLLFLTEKAEKMNFWDNGQYNRESNQLDLPNIGLNTRLERLKKDGAQFQINHKRIKEGFSQEEIWSIFDTVADEIQEEDQIIFDITHAFRFLPMLGIVLLNYLKVTKNITVLGIHYGAFEKLGSFQEVNALKLEDRNAPIIDLNTLLEFQSWTSAVNSFVKFGETKELIETSQPKIKSRMSETKGSDLATKDLRYVIEQLSDLTSDLQTNRLNLLLAKDFTLFKEKLASVQNTSIIVKPFKQILKLVEKKATPIITSRELIWLESAKWCLEHKLIQQAYTQLQEGLLTHSMILIENEINSNNQLMVMFEKHQTKFQFERSNISDRLFISSLLNFIYKTAQNKIKGEDEEQLIDFSSLLQTEFFIKLGTVYAHITEPRNDINHAGIRSDPMKSESLQKKIGELIKQVENLVKI